MIEIAILASLVFNDAFTRKTLPYISNDYFEDLGHKVVFKLIKDHYLKYNKCPTISSLTIDLEGCKLADGPYKSSSEVLKALVPQDSDLDWLVDSTEEFCKNRALYNAITKSAALLDEENSSRYGKMLEHVQNALSVTFDTQIGHDYIEDAEARFDAMRLKKPKTPCLLETFNKVLRGGFLASTLTIFIAPTGVGKSIFLGHFASQFLMMGKNVLYITLEMTEEQISNRVDAALLDVTMDELDYIERSSYMKKILRLKQKSLGKLIVKEYPAHSAHSGHFRHLINELKLKKKFKPDVILIDYLGICGSARAGKDANSYTLLKTVAEEVRALGQEFDCLVFSAMQVNKEGSKSSDFEIYDTAESWGVPATADYMYGIIENDELKLTGQYKVKRLKDRWNDKDKPSYMMIGIDKAKMNLYDLDENVEPEPQQQQKHSNSKFSSLIT